MANFTGLVTRNSNGSIEITPVSGGNVLGKIEMGSEVSVDFAVLRSAAEIEKDRGGKARATASGTPGARDQLEPAEDAAKRGSKK